MDEDQRMWHDACFTEGIMSKYSKSRRTKDSTADYRAKRGRGVELMDDDDVVY